MLIKNIESKIRLASFIALFSLVSAIIMIAIVSYFAFKQVSNSRKTVYIFDQNQVPIQAKQTDVLMNREAEYKSHIGRYHSLFFSLLPDDKYIDYQMQQAMYLIDESGALQYNNLKEKGYFNSILSSSAVLSIQTDSIKVDMRNKYFRYYGRQKIDRRSSYIIRSIMTEGYLADLETRSENNPHAVLIIKWKTLENKDLQHVQKSSL